MKAKRKTKPKVAKIKNADYPLIGYEYEYIGQPVRIVRVCPSAACFNFIHIEFETRYSDRSECNVGELSPWQDTSKPLTKNQATMVMVDIRNAIEDATNDSERKLAQWQLRRLMKLAKAK